MEFKSYACILHFKRYCADIMCNRLKILKLVDFMLTDLLKVQQFLPQGMYYTISNTH